MNTLFFRTPSAFTISSGRFFKSRILGVLLGSLLGLSLAQAGLSDFIPKGETYTVTATDRDVAFLIDGYIYDARQFCYMRAGDKVVFFTGRHGLDYRATVYNLTGKESCDLLLRGRYYTN